MGLDVPPHAKKARGLGVKSEVWAHRLATHLLGVGELVVGCHGCSFLSTGLSGFVKGQLVLAERGA